MRSLSPLVLLALLAVAGCDSATDPPPAAPSAALLGTWTVAEVRYQEYFTPAEDVTVLSPYAPAGGGITVPGLDGPALRYVTGVKQFGTACAASPCFDLFEFSNTPRTYFNDPALGESDETELTLQIHDGRATLYVDPYGGGASYSNFDAVAPTVTATSITVPDLTVHGAGAELEVRGGRFDLPISTHAAGIEASVLPPVGVQPWLVGEATFTFSEGGSARVEWSDREASTGTWAIEGGVVTLTLGDEIYRGSVGSTLRLARADVCANGVPGPCMTVASGRLFLPNGSLESARFEWSYMLSKTAGS